MSKVKIVLDAISTDGNLEEIVKGAFKCVDFNKNLILYLVGPETEINPIIEKNNLKNENIILVNATDKITNEDVPTYAIRKKVESSLYKCFQLLKENDDINGLVSAGATGAILCGSIMILKPINNCRPALSTLLPMQNGEFFCLIDCGANVDCNASQLVDYARLGSVYMETLYPERDIKVGLASNGSEDGKGNILTKEVFQLLKQTDLNFVGNIEGNDILSGKCDVLVCDGFIGNIILKNIEGTAKTIIKDLFMMIKKSDDEQEKLYLQQAIERLLIKYDFNSRGGATLLGVNKVIMKGHGSANGDTIFHVVNKTYQLLENGIIEKLNSKTNNVI